MVQGLIAGATDYSYQTLQEILEDVNKWINYAEEIKNEITDLLVSVQESECWKKTPFNFQSTVKSSVYYCDTIINDLTIVQKAIEKNYVTQVEVALLKTIGEIADDYNRKYGIDYHMDGGYWHREGDPDFEIIGKIYADGRDFYATLQDASNAAFRMEDYMKTGNIMNYIGGNVTGSQIQVGTVNSSQSMINGATEFPYDETLKTLLEISSYKDAICEQFGENSGTFCEALGEAVEETKNKGNSDKIKKLIDTMKDIASMVTSGLIVEGIKGLLNKLPF